MFEFLAVIFGLGVAAQVVFWVVAAVLFPVFWLWMLIDGALRTEAEYPGGSQNEKIVWLVLMIVFQAVSIVYFFAVFRRVRRGAAAVPSQPQAAPPIPSVA